MCLPLSSFLNRNVNCVYSALYPWLCFLGEGTDNLHLLRCSVVSDSLHPHGLWSTRLLCPWDFPGRNTGVCCHSLLQRIFLTQGLNPDLLHCRWILYCLSHQGSGIERELCENIVPLNNNPGDSVNYRKWRKSCSVCHGGNFSGRLLRQSEVTSVTTWLPACPQ